MPTPNLDGFRDAQQRLMDGIGQQIVLIFDQESVWPDGTKLDPESGQPLDPFIQPTSSGMASCAVVGSIGRRPANTRLQSGLQYDPIGVIQGGPAQVLISENQYPAASGEPQRAVVQDTEFKVENMTFQHDFGRYVLEVEPRG